MVDGSRYVLNIDSPMIEQKPDAYLMQYNTGRPQTSISQQHQTQNKLQYQIQNSPYNNNSSSFDRGSSIASNNLGCGPGGMLGSSTFKNNQGELTDGMFFILTL